MMRAGHKRALFGVSVVLGFMLSLEFYIDRTPTQSPYTSYYESSQQLTDALNESSVLGKTLSRGQHQLQALGEATRHTVLGVRLLQQELNALKAAAGLSVVKGPGIAIKINYDPNLPVIPGLRYVDEATQLQMVVNLLDASGAKSIAINDQRLVTTSTIRSVNGLNAQVGPFSGVLQVNGVPIQAPYILMAVGSAQSMVNALNVEGIAAQFNILEQSFHVTQINAVTLPAYTGVLPGRYAMEVGL